MNKIYCTLDECKIGDILATDIYNQYGVLVVPEGSEMTEYIIARLRNLNIENVAIYQPDETVSFSSYKYNIKKLKENYNTSVDVVKNVLNDIASGKKVEYEKIIDISDALIGQAKTNFGVLECLNELKTADQYTYTHSVNVALYAMLLGKWAELAEWQLRELVNVGLLHDIGKAFIPPEILNKTGTLTPEEYEIVKRHPVAGYNLIKDNDEISPEIKKAVLMHHERENGTGYPLGASGSQINIYAKIAAIADVYDAITSDRVYRKKLTPFAAFREFERIGIGTGIFDTGLLLTFLKNISGYYTGIKVKLSNGEEGEVVYIPPNSISTPVVKVGNKFFDLYIEKDIDVVEII